MTDLSPSDSPEIQAMVRDIVDTNRYMVLGTTEPTGLPRLSPVYYTHHEYQAFYWVSGADAQHSENIARQPEIAIVIFDSSVDPASTRAVYIMATAQQVLERELPAACAVAFKSVGRGARPFEPRELTSPARLRLYRATVIDYAVHIRGSDPRYGDGVDKRLPTTLPATTAGL
jgi:nitroimidazol reductase NimA-like FMN-containing flavoprotein (pyridoxamine 5'-phosphate oxidase superfamily)